MGQAEPQPRRYTPDEYFALEEQSEVRHDYFDGEIFARTGASKVHNFLAFNMTLALKTGLRGRACQVLMENVRLVVQHHFHYTYPDVVVTCHPDDLRDGYLVRHPLLIVEVLSPSTEEYDREEKFKQYQQLASLHHYVLIHQKKWFVEWRRRNAAGEWVLQLLDDPADVLEISELGLHLPLIELYADTGVAPMRVLPPLGPEK